MTYTVQQIVDGQVPAGTELWLPTFNGPKQFSYIRGHEHCDPWVVTGTGYFNQSSWCVHYGTRLYTSRDEALNTRPAPAKAAVFPL